jgi:hypothetical protein
MKRTVQWLVFGAALCGALLTAGLASGCGRGPTAQAEADMEQRERSLRERNAILQRSGGRWELLTLEERGMWLGPARGDEQVARQLFEAEHAATAGATKTP